MFFNRVNGKCQIYVGLHGGQVVLFEKRGEDKARYVYGLCAHDVRRVSSGRSQLFSTGIFSPAVHTIIMFSTGGGSLSLLLEADNFGFA